MQVNRKVLCLTVVAAIAAGVLSPDASKAQIRPANTTRITFDNEYGYDLRLTVGPYFSENIPTQDSMTHFSLPHNVTVDFDVTNRVTNETLCSIQVKITRGVCHFETPLAFPPHCFISGTPDECYLNMDLR